ncbi:MAG TPA: hypothetical protein VLY63_11240 [Anaerolineae bacterium]|nr:hypothetical protein [Anaerolineae bacterium]
MKYLPESNLHPVEEAKATGSVAQMYADIKRDFQFPYLPNMMKTLAVSPAALTGAWGLYGGFLLNTTLPRALTSMILYTVAESRNCEYCTVINEFACRNLGVDEETLSALVKDLGNVTPERIRAIIAFALKVSHDPQGLVAADFERLREHGITDEEIVEIALNAAMATFFDILADSLKVENDPEVVQGLGR